MNHGDGTYTAAQNYFAAAAMIIAADMDGDGIPDLAYPSGSEVVIRRNNGDGTFTLPPSRFWVGSFSFGKGISTADFDGNGRLDLVVAHPYSDSISILLNRSNPLPPQISINPTIIVFAAAQGTSLPQSESLLLSNSGGGILNWSLADNAPWLEETPITGNGNSQVISITVNTTSLSVGVHNAMVSISSSNADNSPQTLTVLYQIYQPMSIVSGQVFDKFTNGMLNGVTVELWQSGSLKYSAVTSPTGEYGFGTIPSGTYEIRINHPGYYAFTRTDDIVELTEMLAPVFLYDTSLYVSTVSLRTAFEAFPWGVLQLLRKRL